MLDRCTHACRFLTERKGGCQLRGPSTDAREGAPRVIHESARCTWRVGNRCEIEVHPRRGKRGAGGTSDTANRRNAQPRAHDCSLVHGFSPGQATNATPLLVDGDEERRASCVAGDRLEVACELREPLHALKVPAEEDHAANLAALDTPSECGRRRAPIHAHDQLLADHLLDRRRAHRVHDLWAGSEDGEQDEAQPNRNETRARPHQRSVRSLFCGSRVRFNA